MYEGINVLSPGSGFALESNELKKSVNNISENVLDIVVSLLQEMLLTKNSRPRESFFLSPDNFFEGLP